MKFTKPTLIALTSVAAVTPSIQAWNMGPTRYVSVPTLQVSSSASVDCMLERERMIARRMFEMVDDLQQQQTVVRRYPSSSLLSPSSTSSRRYQRYELIDNNDKFELKVDVPGVKMEDLDIKLDNGKITIEGQRMVTSDDKSSQFTSKFSKTFSLDKSVDIDKFTASLDNGVLFVSAPKDLAKLEGNIRKIPIMPSSVAKDDSIVAEAKNDREEISTGDNSQQEEEDKKVGVNEENNEIPSSSSEEEEEEETDNGTLDLDASNKEA